MSLIAFGIISALGRSDGSAEARKLLARPYDLVVLDWDAAMIIDEPRYFDETLYVLEMANVVDRMRDEAFIMLVKAMNERPEVTRQALDALLIARNLERVADHATNIAEDVIFWIRGADVRHNAAPEETSQAATSDSR